MVDQITHAEPGTDAAYVGTSSHPPKDTEVTARQEFEQAAQTVFSQCSRQDNRMAPAAEPLAQVLTEQFAEYLKDQGIELTPDHARALAGSIGFDVNQLPQSLLDSDPQDWVNTINAGLASFRGLNGGKMDTKTLGSLVTAWGVGKFFTLNLDNQQAIKAIAAIDALAISEASGHIPPDTRTTIFNMMKITADRAAMQVPGNIEEGVDARVSLQKPFEKILYGKPYAQAPSDFMGSMQRPYSAHLNNMDRAQIAVGRLRQ